MFFLASAIFLPAELINQPVVTIYKQPEENAQVRSQVPYSTPVLLVEQTDGGWSHIKTLHSASGWVKTSEIVHNPSFENSESLRPISNLFANVYRVPDVTLYSPLITLPYGSYVKVEALVDARWVSIELASGEKAWIQRGDIELEPKTKTLEEVLVFSRKFLGLPYTWGGTSSYGFDCSGFTQMLFKEMDVLIPRNSRSQAESDLFIAVELEDLEPGDLIFFGKPVICHVGLYLGEGEFIQASVKKKPIIQITKLEETDDNIVAIRRLKKTSS